MLTIEGDSYFITKDNQTYGRKEIEWWSDNCMFKLNSDENQIKVKADSTSRLQKGDSINVLRNMDGVAALQNTFSSYGGHCYELTNRRKFRLTYCGNLHITIAEGRIIRK